MKNGKIISSKSANENLKCFIALVQETHANQGTLYVATGNSSLDLTEIENYLENQIIDIKIN